VTLLAGALDIFDRSSRVREAYIVEHE